MVDSFWHLSEEELAFLKDKEYMPMKFRISKKLEENLSYLHQAIQIDIETHADHLFRPLLDSKGKISKGENYHTYTYRVLDYPRIFHTQGILLFRSLILWGHHISFHLIMTEKFKELFQLRTQAFLHDHPQDFYIASHKDPWQWKEDEDYKRIAQLPQHALQTLIRERKFLKISRFLPLDQYAQLKEEGLSNWQMWREQLFLDA